MQPSFSLFPLGDNALLVDFGNVIDEAVNLQVLALFHQLKQQQIPAIKALVPAYSSLSVHYDVAWIRKHSSCPTAFEQVAEWVQAAAQETNTGNMPQSRTLSIPVCYAPEYAPDLAYLSETNNITPSEVIALHTAATYRVFMIGFLPGFPYMGRVDQRIAIPRKAEPRKLVPAGSVGIAGQQTGIYPQASPGGWQIIGRTPMKLFDPHREQPALLQPGDLVTFYPISSHEFAGY